MANLWCSLGKYNIRFQEIEGLIWVHRWVVPDEFVLSIPLLISLSVCVCACQYLCSSVSSAELSACLLACLSVCLFLPLRYTRSHLSMKPCLLIQATTSCSATVDRATLYCARWPHYITDSTRLCSGISRSALHHSTDLSSLVKSDTKVAWCRRPHTERSRAMGLGYTENQSSEMNSCHDTRQLVQWHSYLVMNSRQCLYVYMYADIQTYNMYVCMCVCMYECLYVCLYLCVYACVCMYLCVYACLYVYMHACFVCMYICMYVFIQTISITPLQVHFYQKRSRHSTRILCRSFTPKRYGQLRMKDLRKVPTWRL